MAASSAVLLARLAMQSCLTPHQAYKSIGGLEHAPLSARTSSRGSDDDEICGYWTRRKTRNAAELCRLNGPLLDSPPVSHEFSVMAQAQIKSCCQHDVRTQARSSRNGGPGLGGLTYESADAFRLGPVGVRDRGSNLQFAIFPVAFQFS